MTDHESPGRNTVMELLTGGTDSRQELTEQELLLGLYDQMLGGIYRTDVLRRITDVVRGTLNAERATIYVVVKETQELESLAASNLADQLIRVPIKEGSLAGYCALTGRAFAVADAYADLKHIDPRLSFDRSWDERHGFRTRDVICVPISFRGEVLGVIQVINHRAGSFSERDIPMLISISRMVGHALHYALLYDEIATLKRLKQQKAEFMRIMTHELKAPVAAAKTIVDAICFSQDASPGTMAMLERLGARLDGMLEMVGDILEFSAVNAGAPLGEICSVDIVKTTADVCADYTQQAQAKGLELRLDLHGGALPVRIDRQGYRLILSNLLSNAIKYTPAGSVSVRLDREDGRHALLEVTDTGMGIPRQDQPRMFQEFFRASNARKAKINGTGVGLAGVKGIVERFGGELGMRSREGAGTTFTVKLPLEVEVSPTASPEAAA